MSKKTEEKVKQQPTISAKSHHYELRADVVNMPSFYAGKYRINAYGVAIIYRRYAESSVWEFIHVTVNGVWLGGDLKGKSTNRRYGRSTVDRLPDWLITFINDNIPEIEDTES